MITNRSTIYHLNRELQGQLIPQNFLQMI